MTGWVPPPVTAAASPMRKTSSCSVQCGQWDSGNTGHDSTGQPAPQTITGRPPGQVSVR